MSSENSLPQAIDLPAGPVKDTGVKVEFALGS